MSQPCPRCNTSNPPSASYCAVCGLQLVAPVSQNLKPGQVLQNRYRIASLLGQGGFGAVYRAWDTALKRSCAVKENLETDLQARNQFQQEASVLANLSHTNLPRVTDHFVIPGQGQYLVMDFVEGQDLDSLVQQQGPLNPKIAIDLISQIADALTYLHSQPRPVIHRDIKPANIRLRADGRAFLVDFGLVKLFATHKMTTAGARGVTPGFSPPEQYGQGGTDARTDVYALGATLYTLLTGMVPQESVTRAARDSLNQAHLINPAIPVTVSSVVSRAMALDPDRRYQSAAEFKAALAAALSAPAPTETQVILHSQPVAQPGQAVSSPVSKPVLSGMAIGAVAMGVILVVILGGVWLVFGGRSTPTPVVPVVDIPEDSQEQAAATPTPQVEEISATEPETEGDDLPTLTLPPSFTPTLTPSQTPTPLPISRAETNGEWIAYAYGDVYWEKDIFMMNMVTGQRRQLTSGKRWDEAPTFSPDGRSLVFVSCRPDCELYLLDLHSLSEKKLTSLPIETRFPNYCNDPAKPWIVFEGRDDPHKNAWLLKLDSGDLRQLTNTNADSRPMFSPDCSRIVFGRATTDTDHNGQITTNDYLDVYILDIETLSASRLTNTPGQDEFNFAWSSDGEWIAFCRVSSDTNNDDVINLNDRSDLFIIRPDGGGERPLDINRLSAFSPSWSPDGHSVMFSAYESEGNQSIWSYSLDTFALIQHTEAGPYYHPEWSP